MSLFKRIKSKKGKTNPTTTPVTTTVSSASSAVDAGSRSGTRTTLQNLSTVLEIGKSVGDASQLLGPMKTVCGVLQTLVNISITIQANGEDLQDLVDKLERQLEFVKQQLTVLDGPDFREAKLANRDLVNVFENYYASSSRLLATNAKIVEEEIGDLARKLDDSFQQFMISVNSFVAKQAALISNKLTDLEERFALSQLPLADARGNMHNPCLEGTRVDLLEQIYRWAINDAAVPVLALIDLAGTGKSTIATHMAKQWEKDKTSATQFFFSKPTTVTGKNFASTIARDIAQSIPHLRPIILLALKEHTDIAARSIQEQLEWIVFGPLRSTSQTHIIIIDALDECSSIDRSTILAAIFKFLHEYPVGQSPLKVFLTSRPEADIMNHFSSPMNKNFIVCLDFSLRPELSQYNLDDIRLYVETYLGDRLIPEEIDKFITRTGGLFIWASTAVQFLLQAKNFNARFQTLMSPNRKSPLDDLYSEILKASLAGYQEEEEVLDMKKVLQAICVAREPLNVAEMDELLRLDSGVAEAVVKSLGSILSDGAKGQPVYVLHPTFLEHLQNPSRPGPVFISNEEAEGLVAGGCLRSLCGGLKYDIRGILQPKTTAPKNEEVEDLKQRLEERTTPALRYAAIHALSHVRPCLGDKGIVAKLHNFFESKLLEWIELVSLLGKVYSAIQALYDLKCRIEEVLKSSSNALLLDNQEWCDETLNLIQPYQTVIGASAMQVYFSALAFFPQTTRISRCFLPSLQHSIPKVLYQKTPSSGSKVLAGHQSGVRSISISSDDHYVTSLDYSGKIRRWDVVTGGCVEELSSIKELNKSSSHVVIQLLTDGIIAAVIHAESIALHNLRTGKVLWEVQYAVKDEWKYDLAWVVFSPDGRFLASYYNLVVQIWDVETGQEHWRKQSESEIIGTALSPDSMLLANVNEGGVVRLWDIATGRSVVLPTALDHDYNFEFVPYYSLSFSSDGTVLVGLLPGLAIRLWYLKDGEVIRHQDIANSGESNYLAFSPFSQILACAVGSTIHLYDAASGKAVGEPLRGHTSDITCLAFLSNRRTLASGSEDTTVRMWRLSFTEVVDQPRIGQGKPDQKVTCLALSPDGLYLASVYNGREICLWDAEAGKVNWQFKADDDDVICLAFSSDGQTLASGYHKRDVELWGVASGQVFGSIPGSRKGNGVMCLVFSSDSRLVVTAAFDKNVVAWEVPSGKMVAECREDTGWIDSMSFHVHQGKDFLIIRKKYMWDISADLLYHSNDDKAPFKLVDLHSNIATVRKPWVSISRNFTFSLPPHVECDEHDYKKGKFACGGKNGVELIVDCSHVI